MDTSMKSPAVGRCVIALVATTALQILAFAPAALAQSAGIATGLAPEQLERSLPGRSYSPYTDRGFPERPLFGDTHLHTSFSMDAGAAGARLTPADAYRFAKGEQIMASSGQPVRLGRPLDFLVVADHSDQMGFFPDLFAANPRVLADPTGRRWYDMIQSGQGAQAAFDIIQVFSSGSWPEALNYVPGTPGYRSAWEATVRAAEEANDPGRFTAFIGYEWTSNTGGNNLHRNVIYRDGASHALQMEPMVTMRPYGSDDPRDLWTWLETYEERTGGNVLAIAHNGNLSGGMMFPLIEPVDGEPLDAAYAETRARWEPIYEVTQMKGDGESHPFLSPNDEFAGYETWDKANLAVTEPTTTDMLEFMYARSALKNGLALEQELGTNPFRFGMIGSTDAHTGLATAEEDNFFGKVTSMEPSAERLRRPFMQQGGITIMEWEVAASGYAAVWATENTREAIFDAMERREVYGTTGPRMVVRLFGGWDFEPEDAESRTPSATGYTRGVPMGGDLTDAPEGVAPRFLVAALRDPVGANLDRVQIVKGWLDGAGELQEQVYDVAWSDGREPGEDGRLPAVGSTVDVESATWTNTIGAPELITVWEDPDFDPAEPAFYYARVLEIPTPRWTAYDAKYFELDDVDPAIPMETQERAYTSPIWYTPGD
jgi:hypothetical protein